MKKINIKKVQETIGVSENLAGKYLRGVARPSFENIYTMNKKLKVPFHIWLDKETQRTFFLHSNNTINNGNTTSLQG
jgi:transcriptional regulator with XRE-family HTH domain